MNIADFSIKKKVITWMIVILFIAGGIFAYENLGRYEDPEFTIKDALIITQYPGATPKEVEQEVTEKIETAVQQLAQLKRVTSLSWASKSEITVTIKDNFDKNTLPQVWDELRRKVNDVQPQLPPGAGPSVVNDDFGDVYGMMLALTGSGFSFMELKDYADFIKRELLLVPGVAKVQITGERKEAIFVDVSRAKMTQLGISQEQLYQTLRAQNFVNQSGSVRVGDEYIRIEPSGGLTSIEEISNLLLSSKKSKKLVHLSDVAKVSRGYIEVPENPIYYNGKQALLIGISIVPGGNVVKIGDLVTKDLHRLSSIVPVGIGLEPVYYQPTIVNQSVQGFMLNLAEALAIVIVVLLIFMGLRSGLIIASILLLTVMGTLFFMYLFGINLERISLGALIIALGMLVDNAIVVTEGILVKVQQGVDKIKAAQMVVGQTMWPLLGATIVGILAFAAIGLSQDSTGEYTRSLFYVILISLMLSWLLAVMVAPLFCYHFLKTQDSSEQKKDPYSSGFYTFYKKFLTFCLKIRWITVLVMIGLLILSIYGFTYVKQSFFPNSTTPLFYVDYWRSEGTDIRATERDMLQIEKYIQKIEGVKAVTMTLGKGAPRLMLVYEPEKPNTAFGQFLIQVKDYRDIEGISKKIKKYIAEHYPDSEPKALKIRLGPGKTAKIEVRFSGPDAAVLRKLSDKAQEIMHENSNAIDIRDDWRQKVKVIEPVYSDAQARRTGITRSDLRDALQTTFTGMQVGLYRERDHLIPIISRPPELERLNISNIDDIQVWSPLLQMVVPVGQLVSKFNTKWENAIVRRRDRRLTITASCNPRQEPASILFKELKPKIEAIKLPAGYHLEWGGEYEDSMDAQVALAKQLPVAFLAMILIVIALFSAIRQPLIIWLCVPLSMVGVTFGLLITQVEFGFMALLGFLSLSGMLIKNAIVLVDQIDLEIREGKDPFQAIIDSSIGRMRPVALAAVTTVLGMIPLLFDAFFESMAIVIMFGLTFATILTLIVVPVLYAIFFKAKYQTSTNSIKST